MSSTLAPIAQAQEVRPNLPGSDGDKTVGCKIDWNAEAVYDPHFADPWSTKGFTENVNSKEGFNRFFQVQHFNVPQAPPNGLTMSRIAFATDKTINNAKLVVNLQEVEGKAWALSGVEYRLFGPSEAPYPNNHVAVSESIAGNVATYDLGNVPAGSKFTPSQRIQLSLAELTELTKPAADGTWSNAFMVNARLTGDLAPGSTEDCAFTFGYNDAETGPGVPVDPTKVGEFDFPDQTKFTTDNSTLPDGWDAVVDPDTGKLTVTPPADAAPGTSTNVTVTATLPDGRTETTTVKVTVVGESVERVFGYNDAETGPGVPVDPTKVGEFNFPDQTKFTTDNSTLPDGWDAVVDPDTGKLTVTPPADAAPGTSTNVTVTATLPDGRTETTTVKVTVVGEDADVVFGYTDADTKPGVPVDPSKVPGFDLPEGTIYDVDEDDLPAGWTADVDPDGTLTVTPPATAKDGDSAKIKVTATLPDGTVKETSVTVTVRDDDGAVVPGAGTCVAAGLTVGLPLLLLVPVGMAGQLNIPGLDQLNADLQAQLRNANSQLQQQFGIFDPAQAQYINQINSEIARFTADNRTIINGAAMVALGLLAAAYLYNSCVGEDGTSSMSSLSSGSSE
ncbi:YPDG domain-containing protein [Corynebacterium testudinoris]|nr:YPDG domain-containing protein [Corynebacterium testudinoris]